MKYFIKLFTGIMFSILIFSGSAHATNLIVNPSFEDGNWVGNWSWDRVYTGEDVITGWTIGGYAVDWHNSAEMYPTHSGLYVVDLNADNGGTTGTISQTINTVVNHNYVLSFYLASPLNYGATTNILNVNINGTNYLFAKNPAGRPMDWTLNTINFLASSATTTITFSSINAGAYWGPVLDDVSLEDVSPTPEPSSAVLGLMGIAGLLGLKRKQK